MEFERVEVGVLLLRSWCFGECCGALAIANTCDGRGLETLTVEWASALATPYQYERNLINRLNEATFGVQPYLTL